MAYRQNIALRNVIGDSIRAEFAGGTLQVRTGTQPASAGDAASGTLLAEITLPSPAFGASASGVISKSGTWSDTSANASGLAGYVRMVSAANDRRIDLAVGTEVIFDDADIVAGGVVTVVTATITLPSGE